MTFSENQWHALMIEADLSWDQRNIVMGHIEHRGCSRIDYVMRLAGMSHLGHAYTRLAALIIRERLNGTTT